MTELWRSSATELRRDYDAGVCTPVDVIESCLQRIDEVDSRISAFTLVAGDRALSDAETLSRELRRGTARGPLHGVPFAVKELFDVTGTVTTAGSRLPVAGHVDPSSTDAVVVQRLRAAGAVFIGKTRTHEYAWGITTRYVDGTGTANPWNLGRIPGGSSGGSAAAVAAGCVPVALGTDTGGSIRIPASFCGVVGWKPRLGSIPTDGLVPLAPSLDHVGFLTRDIQDAASAHSIAVEDGHEVLEPPPTRSLRLGVLDDPPLARLEPSIEAAIRLAMDELASAGAAIRPVSVPSWAEGADVFSPIQMREALRVHREVLGTWPGSASSYGSDVADRLRLAESVTDEDFATATARRSGMTTELGIALADVDALIVPVAACSPADISDPNKAVLGGERVPLREAVLPFTLLANLTGAPCVVIPVGRDRDGLPVGIQVLAAPEGNEIRLLAVAETLFQILGSPGWPIL